MPALRNTLTLCVLFLSVTWAAADQPISRPASEPLLPVSLSPLEQQLFADAADGRLDHHSLLSAALVAGGVTDPAELASYECQVNALADQLREQTASIRSPRQKAQAIFEFMHGHMLRGGYRLNATELTTVLREGRFNCVSASVLYCHLAGQCGLDARGLELPGHAMCRLYLDGEKIEVESTCPRWFQLTDDPQRRAELIEKTTGFRHGDPARAAQAREVSGVALVATIYYNRGVDLLGEKRFEQAVQSNTKALWLDPTSSIARGNLLATLNNWSIAEGAAGRHEKAVELLRAGMSLQPDFHPFQANFVHVHRQWIESLCRQGKYEASSQALLAASNQLPEEPWFGRTLANVYRQWVSSLLVDGNLDGAFAVLDKAARLQSVHPQLRQLETDEIGRYVAWLNGQGRNEDALAVLDRALHRHPNATLLADSRRTILAAQSRSSRLADSPRPAVSDGHSLIFSDTSVPVSSEGHPTSVSW